MMEIIRSLEFGTGARMLNRWRGIMSNEVEIFEGTDRQAICRMLAQLFVHWKLTDEECLAVLGRPSEDHAVLTKLRNSDPTVLSARLLEQAGHLLGIHKNLRRLFPQNRDLAYAWMKTRNRAFKDCTPINLIGEKGLAGLWMVRAYLDAASE